MKKHIDRRIKLIVSEPRKLDTEWESTQANKWTNLRSLLSDFLANSKKISDLFVYDQRWFSLLSPIPCCNQLHGINIWPDRMHGLMIFFSKSLSPLFSELVVMWNHVAQSSSRSSWENFLFLRWQASKNMAEWVRKKKKTFRKIE